MSYLKLAGISKYYGYTPAIKDLNLEIEEGEFVVLLGPSGCGKTTILRMIAGLEDITIGELFIDDIQSTQLSAKERQIAMVFQSYALYPHMTVEGNLCYGMRSQDIHENIIKEALDKTISILHIKEEWLSRQIHELSGGQRQRIAIGRALMKKPKLYLFDEPLANLDASLRTQMKLELIQLHKKLKNTMIFVTHDQHEAMTLATKIAIFNDGVLEQYGTPLEIFHRPANRFVASFIGTPTMNFYPATFLKKEGTRNHLKLFNGRILIAETLEPCTLQEGEECEIGIRPYGLYISSEEDSLFSTHIALVEMLGDQTIIYGDVDNEFPVSAKLDGHIIVQYDTTVHLATHSSDIYLFDKNGTSCIRKYFPE